MSTVTRSTDAPWRSTTRMPSVPKLNGDLKTDVCVVGAGVAGLSVAYELVKEGKRVAVIDDGRLAGGQTQVTTAHLSSAVDCRYSHIERVHGAEAARLVAEAFTFAIDQIERHVRELRLACDFERLDGYLFRAPDDDSDELDQEFEVAQHTGALQVVRAARAPLPGLDTGPCLCFERQGQFHPLKYLGGIARAILRDGGKVFGNTHADSIEGGPHARVETKYGKIEANAIVVATNTPVNDRVSIHTKQAAYLTYAIGAHLPRHAVERALYWDTADPYHYVRLWRAKGKNGDDDEELLIVGGEDHKTGQANDGEQRFERLEAWARQRFPMMGEIKYHWAGQVMESNDGLGFIGRNPGDKENVFICTGDCGQGMIQGTIAGKLITDLILGRENPWTAAFDPARIRLAAGKEFVREALNMAAQYRAWLTPGEVETVEDVEPGHGAIIRSGLKKIAVYRSDKGQVTRLSAVCPHLGCIVAWNDTEQTWDCPCHGSRFAPTGSVLNGPANSGLPPVED